MGSSGQFQRIGVFFTPPKGPLAAFGASWLGWDIATGTPQDHPALPGVPIPISFLTATARKYGFHATIKAPFRLADGRSIADVEQALEQLCHDTLSQHVGALEMVALGRFLALTLKDPPDVLKTMATRVVQQLDPFRAPLSDTEFARKDNPKLSDRQRDNLKTYGYPHVGDDYKFHFTLTDRLSKPHLAAVQSALTPMMTDALPRTLIIDALSLVGETRSGQFQVIRRFKLGF